MTSDAKNLLSNRRIRDWSEEVRMVSYIGGKDTEGGRLIFPTHPVGRDITNKGGGREKGIIVINQVGVVGERRVTEVRTKN